jgi:molybdenum cofactor cytidylyltransferase
VLTGMVLSAGESTRMGSPKALLSGPSGRPFVTHIVRTLRAAGLADILVITGSHHASIEEAIMREGVRESVRLIRNPDPSRGQLSSIWTGLDALPANANALLMTLVDVPMIDVRTVSAVVEAWRLTRAPIVRPIVNGRRGHPVIFDRCVFDELRTAPLDTGARAVVKAHWSDSVDVPVDDPGCVVDIDTRADYDRLRQNQT